MKYRETLAVNELMNDNSTRRPAVTGAAAAAADDDDDNVTMATTWRPSAVDNDEMLWTHLTSVNITGLEHFTEYMVKVCHAYC